MGLIRKLVFLSAVLLLIAILVMTLKAPNKMVVKTGQAELKNDCMGFGGNYLADYNECEFRNIEAGKSACKKMRGNFSDCASACRHSTKSGSRLVCTMECVGVCRWN